MPKRKQDFNTIYISERLQEALRPISRCALTSVVAPMGYGKTTAVNWYLAERRKEENARIIRISVYSDNLAIFWKSVQDAFLRAGLSILLIIPARRMLPAAVCWQMTFAMRLQEKSHAIFSLTIFIC